MKIINGTSHSELSQAIAKHLGVAPMNVQMGRFPDGEFSIRLLEDVRDEDVYVFQSLSPGMHDHLVELLLILDTVRLGGAQSITALVPYLSYARQDRMTGDGTPLSGDLMMNLITCAGADQILTVDLHGDGSQGFLYQNVNNLFTTELFSGHIRELYGCVNEIIIVSPDRGGEDRARRVAECLGVQWCFIEKSRDEKRASRIISGAQDISCKKCIIIDDIVDTAYTLCNAAELVVKAGAVSVTAFVTHAVLSDGALTRLRSSPLDKVFVTDSIQANAQDVQSARIEQISLSSLMAQAILRRSDKEVLKFA